MNAANSEKRSDDRTAFSSPIEFRAGPNHDGRHLSAEVINISAKGLRLYSACPLGEGQEILVYDPMPKAASVTGRNGAMR
mgnify:CR=1 FL=1